MADIEKVIKAIECCIDDKHGCYNCEFKYTDGKVACRMFEESYNSIPTELIKNALELLKKQEPMKPTVHGTWTDGFTTYEAYYCKSCNGLLQKNDWQFCPWCGQAVKWE